MQLRLSTKAYILIGLPLIFELIFVSILIFTQAQLERAYAKEIHARAVADTINTGLATLLKSLGYLILDNVSREGALENQSQSYFHDLNKVRDRLLALEADNDTERKNIEEFADLVDRLIVEFESVRKAVGKDKNLALVSLQLRGGELIELADGFVERQVVIQNREIERQKDLRASLNTIVFTGIGFNIIIALLLAIAFNRNTIQRLNILRVNADLLARDEALLPKVEGDDEIAIIDGRFHEMADSVRRATKREKAILTNTTDVIFSLNASLEFTFVSPASNRIWRYHEDELIGREIDCVISYGDTERVRKKLLELELSHERGTIECTLVTREAEEIEGLLSVFWSDTENQLFCVSHDITERKQLERLRQEIVSMVTHDLKSPLSSLSIIFSFLLEEETMSKSASKLCSRGKDSVEHMMRLINDLLDAERLEQGILMLEINEFRARDAISRAVDSVKAIADKKRINIKVLGPNVTVRADRERIVQVLINLLNNAIKFSEADALVKVIASESDGSLCIEVIDNGIGIPSQYIDSIFDKFRQARASDSTKRGGSGLGLAISRWLVEQHGGSIGVESQEGRGSRFWFTIPL